MGILTMNNTTVRTKKMNSQTEVHITTEDATVFVNGVCIWSPESPEYQHIPPTMRAFVKERTDYVGMKDEGTKEARAITDLWLKGSNTCVSLFIPVNKKQKITARFDFIESVESLYDNYIEPHQDIDTETATNLLNEFSKDFNSIETYAKDVFGEKFLKSHDTEDGYNAWWDITFKQNEWDETKFLTIWNLISDFNKKANDFMDKYNYSF